MTHRIVLGAPLEQRPFSVGEARARGFGRARMRNAELARPFHGIRVAIGRLGSPIDAFAPRLRHNEWFSHESAARLWNVPLANWENPTDTVHVTIADPGAPSRAKGARGHRTAQVTTIVLRRGLRCSDAATTWLNLASILSLRDLVVAGDHLVLDPEVLDPLDLRPYVTLEELRQRVQSYHGAGKARASRALALLRQGAESRPETLLRLLIRDARLPEPAVNPIIYDATGRRIGRADLVFSEFRVIVEYDGDQHRSDKRQYRKDVRRWQDFMREGWDVLRFHDDALSASPGATQLEIADALARAGCREAVSVAQKHLRAAI
jgi:very-short-patch-repair endonuclease